MDIKNRIEFIKNRLNYFKMYHSNGDDNPFGSGTVGEAKKRFRAELKILTSK